MAAGVGGQAPAPSLTETRRATLIKTNMMEDFSNKDRAHLHPFTPVSDNHAPHILIETLIEFAQSIHVYSCQGTTHLDALSGLWCVIVGYGQPQLRDAIEEALWRISFAHTMFRASHEAIALLADRLFPLCNSADSAGNVNISPSPTRKVFFGHSGSDANDPILKLIRLHFLVHRIIATEHIKTK